MSIGMALGKCHFETFSIPLCKLRPTSEVILRDLAWLPKMTFQDVYNIDVDYVF